MATTVYKEAVVKTVDGVRIPIMPLKIKYLREFMELFQMTKDVTDEEESMDIMLKCVAISMQQYNPLFSSQDRVEDNFDVKTIYQILKIAGDLQSSKDKGGKEEKEDELSKDSSWDKLDLAKLEAEAFLLGIWKDYNELELSLSMPELLSTLDAKRTDDYNTKKFLAAIQGVDLDKQSGKDEAGKGNAWEEMKARVFSRGQAANANDVLALQGINAEKAGFGIGMGLDYQRIEKK